MADIRRWAGALLRPLAEHEADAAAAYEDELMAKYARGMGLEGPRDERLAAHKRATEVAPLMRLAPHRR